MFGSKKYLPGSLLIVIFFIAEPGLAQSEYRFQHFTTKDGLADDFVFSIAQDSSGFMWFGYYGGLTRFDGNDFKVYKYDPYDSLKSALDFVLGPVYVDGATTWLHEQHNMGLGPKMNFAIHDRKIDGFKKLEIDLKGAYFDCMRFDKGGSLAWLGTYQKALFSYNLETGETVNYYNLDRNGNPQRPFAVTDMRDLGSILFLTTGFGLWQFDKAAKTFIRPQCNPKDTAFLYNSFFFGIQERPNGDLWVLLNESPTQLAGELVHLSRDLNVIQRIELPSLNLSRMDIDDEDVIWFGTWDHGLYRLNPKDSSFINIRNVPADPFSLRSDQVNNLKVDREQNVWVATRKGVSKLQRKYLEFFNLEKKVDGYTIYEARGKDFLVIASDYDPLTTIHKILMAPMSPGQVRDFQFQKTSMQVPGRDVPRFFKGKHHFWISTNVAGKGVFGFPINPKTEMIEAWPPLLIHHDPTNPNTISSDQVRGIWEDPEENLWVGGDGLNKVNLKIPYGEKGSVVTFKHIEADTSSLHVNGADQIYPENEKSFWVLGTEGLDLFHRGSQHFEHVYKIRTTDILFRTSDGSLFLGTTVGLSQVIKEGEHYRVDVTPLWKKAEVTAIQEDRLGRLWLYTRIGVVCYDRKEKFAIEFGEDDGVMHTHAIERNHFRQTYDGIMVMADPEGLSLFDPMTLKINKSKTKPLLTGLEVNNKSVVIGNSARDDDDFKISKDVSLLDELVIDYKHNDFTIKFSAMEMTAPETNRYRYKLEGYNEDWIETDYRNRTATYTNLDPRDYIFKVKASNHHGIWSDQETTLSIRVLPPPWKTAWAYSGYGLIFVGLAFLARRNIVQRERLKSNLKLAKVEQEKEHFELEKAKEVDKVKSTFFANISHEFRTPLTLIKGPVQEMLEDFSAHPKVQERMKLVQRNADLVLKLINQLLDLAKLESGTLFVEKTESDLNSFLSVVTSSFSSLAFQKNITLESVLPQPRCLVSMDKDKVETILINLINNAIKFTPAGGAVKIRAEVKTLLPHAEIHSSGTPLGAGGMVTITVSDTGIGIPLDQQTKVFERFHQVSESHKEVGTGIGLALVKELVALLGGKIELKSEAEKGSEFKIVFPIEVVCVISDEENKVEVGVPFGGISSPVEQILNDEVEGAKARVLVVEDNGDLRKFIIDCLGKEFHFLEAADGKQGMEIAFEETPDLIISDVMMPEMDGITMTGKLKKDTRTSHIPLLLLTAKTSDESKLSGLGTGADDYLTKPFNKNELLLKVRNSIAARMKLREKIKLELLKESPKVEVQSEDEKFLHKIRETILNRLSDEQLSVESLAEDIGLSRSQLLRKITALTGISVNELIRTFRLQKAAQLLEQNWGPVTQVAYEVGFSNLSYFSKVFKDQYGVLPSEYAEKSL